MSILSGKSIKERLAKGDLIIKGVREPSIGVTSLDVHLSDKFSTFQYYAHTHIDSRKWDNPARYEKLMPDGRNFVWHDYTEEYLNNPDFTIHPDDLVFGVSKEYFKLPDDLVGRFQPKSALIKMGLLFFPAASWAGSLTPGFEGDFQFGIMNKAWTPVRIFPDMIVGEIFFEKIE
ncbi:hypothetical protein HYS54_03510 [Candidatus Micrarchaeota archaeon]|nr:hypothetical protein [Candidatus Micrarchaeota archaeon]